MALALPMFTKRTHQGEYTPTSHPTVHPASTEFTSAANSNPPKRRRNDRSSDHRPSSCSNPNGNRKPNTASWERLQENEHVPNKRDLIPTSITRTLGHRKTHRKKLPKRCTVVGTTCKTRATTFHL